MSFEVRARNTLYTGTTAVTQSYSSALSGSATLNRLNWTSASVRRRRRMERVDSISVPPSVSISVSSIDTDARTHR